MGSIDWNENGDYITNLRDMIQAQPSRMLVTKDGQNVYVLGPDQPIRMQVIMISSFGKDFRNMSYEDIRKHVDRKLSKSGLVFQTGKIKKVLTDSPVRVGS